jgi:acetyl-CoA carboxylase biotin carboxyl carrier protein
MGDKKQSVDKALIRSLAALLKETELSEIEIEQEGFRVRVSRAGAGAAPHAEPARGSRAPAQGPAEAPGAPSPADPAHHPGMVPSPMVGTVYRSSAPGTRPFVEVGERVAEGQTLLIVEAMKHMNEVPAPRSGIVTAVLVEDGQPVEYGEPLAIIE